ncbi:16S rRNA (cytosine(967)-C(5))-methyltransferase RsmB [Pseudomaricurvus sp. HS19]|uniref:16S rRNA (cytosine(967)-C(5))-methyltransferase RsmB n=1 Tax=Pseudomaricurvus sp. HS19 TaxID=2692626 RepID=UPI0013717F9F|nr:16S rRNA (cytosine(967)-C(5))-methyltransferase RsmB [Pseudomaricurvus sp. HS19]
MPVRAQAATVLAAVLQQQASLASLLPAVSDKVAPEQRPLLQELCFGVCRWAPQLQLLLNRLLQKPLKPKDSDVQALLLIGLYALKHMRTPDHAAISTAVEACRSLKKPWAEKLVNGVLRSYQRDQQSLEESVANSPANLTAHPNWLRKQLQNFWPQQADLIFAANNAHPPMTLRLNTSHQSRDDYSAALQLPHRLTPFSPFGITLDSACDVHTIAGFDDGQVSVQDEAAQLSAGLLDLQGGERVLDACCAPGGKTGHILETSERLPQPLSEVVALDLEERRLQRVRDNLQRLRKQATLICCDALATDQWWDGQLFDRILLDAPCSATGVIRRHPDIKLLRNATDIAKLAALQLQLLQALWPTLRPGGRLVYATCSVLPTENNDVIAAFVAATDDAKHLPIEAGWGIDQPFGRQLLPQVGGHDGFYYACLEKLVS